MAAAWGDYPDTVLRFPPSDLRIDLRLPLSRSALQRLADLGLQRPFAVITACNPLGRRLEPAGNRRLAAVLTQLVHDRYPGAHEAHGISPDESHREPGWALPIGQLEAERLAAQFLQNALFWFDGARFLILPVLAPGEPLPLPAARDAR